MLDFDVLVALMIKLGAAGDGESDQQVFGVLLVMVLGAGPVAVLVKFVYEYAPALCMACGGAKSEPDSADKGDEVDMGMKPEEHTGEEEAKQGEASLSSVARPMDQSSPGPAKVRGASKSVVPWTVLSPSGATEV